MTVSSPLFNENETDKENVNTRMTLYKETDQDS